MIFEVLSVLIGIFLISHKKLNLNRIFIFTAFFGIILSVFSILIAEDLRKNIYFKKNFQNKSSNLDLNYNNNKHITSNKILFKNINFTSGHTSLTNVQYKNSTEKLNSQCEQIIIESILMTKKHILNYDL